MTNTSHKLLTMQATKHRSIANFPSFKCRHKQLNRASLHLCSSQIGTKLARMEL